MIYLRSGQQAILSCLHTRVRGYSMLYSRTRTWRWAGHVKRMGHVFSLHAHYEGTEVRDDSVPRT